MLRAPNPFSIGDPLGMLEVAVLLLATLRALLRCHRDLVAAAEGRAEHVDEQEQALDHRWPSSPAPRQLHGRSISAPTRVRAGEDRQLVAQQEVLRDQVGSVAGGRTEQRDEE
jgi:hypothetical protein